MSKDGWLMYFRPAPIGELWGIKTKDTRSGEEGLITYSTESEANEAFDEFIMARLMKRSKQ